MILFLVVRPGLNMTVMAAQMKLHPITTALQLETAAIYAKKYDS
jgi:hypothetical protein